MQLGTADTLLGEIQRKLTTLGVYDESLFIVTADHGVTFAPGAHRRSESSHPQFYEDVLQVPLFIKLPHQEKGVVENRNAEVVDILPTIVDLLGINSAKLKFSGSSLFSSTERPSKSIFIGRHASTGGVRGIAAEREGVHTLSSKSPQLETTLRWKWSLPGIKTPPDSDPFYIGARSDLIGKLVHDQQTAPIDNITLTIQKTTAVVTGRSIEIAYKPKQGTCPCHLVGSIQSSELRQGDLIALNINGVIRSVTSALSLTNNGAWNFDVIVPESSFVEGVNTVAPLIVRGDRVLLQK
jgi:hypothetical protein